MKEPTITERINVVYQFELPYTGSGTFSIPLPLGSEIVSCGNQHGKMVIWSVVDPQEDRMETHRLHVVETGQKTPVGDVWFVGTVLFSGGDYVLHVFAEV